MKPAIVMLAAMATASCATMSMPVAAPVACEAAQFASGFTFALAVARSTPWADDEGASAARAIDGATYFVATTSTVTRADLERARLTDDGAARVLTVAISDEAAQRLEVDTTLVREAFVVDVNGRVVVVKHAGVIVGPEITIAVDGVQAADVCQGGA